MFYKTDARPIWVKDINTEDFVQYGLEDHSIICEKCGLNIPPRLLMLHDEQQDRSCVLTLTLVLVYLTLSSRYLYHFPHFLQNLPDQAFSAAGWLTVVS